MRHAGTESLHRLDSNPSPRTLTMMTATSLPQGAPLTAPEGSALIEWLGIDPAVRDRVIADGRDTITYGDTPELLARLDRYFARGGMSTEHAVALECSQSLAGALAL